MSLAALDNLVRIGQLKAEPRNVAEAERMLSMARTSLADAGLAWQRFMNAVLPAPTF
jgi:hypothetical protein